MQVGVPNWVWQIGEHPLLLEEEEEEELDPLDEELEEEEEEEGKTQLGILQLEVLIFLQQGSSLARQRKVSSIVQSGISPEEQ